ncbi:MAG TPA: serine/threonine-protein kinase, partial [Kofleriaceae bacterium]
MPGERTIGNYVLEAMLGRGGMSEVHAARHRFLDDRVAIKLLHAQAAGDAEATAAFLAEATRTRAIDHPNVVRVLDFGCDGDDLYLVMELLDGETLAARLLRDGRLDEPEARRLGAAIADGVAAAHARGIVHRDLKPGNIMLVAGEPKIVDFGIARQLGASAKATTGSRSGTLAYMAPEQLTGGLIAACVDVWAHGAILYEALAGRLPFDDFTDGRCPQLVDIPRP